MRLIRVLAAAALFAAPPLHAGGAWVPEPGEGDLQLGYSRKRAHESWSSRGDAIQNTTVSHGQRVAHYHDFRYTYLSGEVGVRQGWSFDFLVTYLDGFEGPRTDFERNKGFSDAWFGIKRRVTAGSWPQAVSLTVRTSMFYDLPGDYSRHLFNSDGSFRAVSPEWRGLLKEDYSLTYLASHSWAEGRGWLNLESGYTYREGAPSDEIPVFAEIGWPLPWLSANVKGTATYIQAIGNPSPRQGDDRFGSRAGFDFNNASHARAGIALLVPFGRGQRWCAEVGYNQWLWGKSARQYEEPYLSIGTRF